ncbi:MAG: ABC transporter substrate-binding protein [Candidatus Paracaedibacteraceae bacterium]|nr:ABC transporter substrate-binding protein [Candidatus Paracaedibacteraceae bacterium]
MKILSFAEFILFCFLPSFFYLLPWRRRGSSALKLFVFRVFYIASTFLWIPAFAGMTANEAEITQNKAGTTKEMVKTHAKLSPSLVRAKQAPLTTVRIALEWFLNPHHAPLIIAQTNGYFADEGLAVNFHPASGSQEGCLQANRGTVEFAITHQPQLLLLADKGIALDIAAVLIPSTLEVILSTCPLDQLLGKTLAHASSGSGSLTFRIMDQFLKSQNLKEGDVNVILAKHGLVSGFMAGQIDVIFNVYKTYQLHDIKKQIKKPFYMYLFKDFNIPSFASMVLACGPAVPTNLRLKIARALQRAIDFIHKNPGEAYDKVRLYRAELDTPENKEVWPIVHPEFAKDVSPKSLPDNKYLKKFLELP